MKECGYCKTQLNDNDRYCHNCGREVAQPNNNYNYNQPNYYQTGYNPNYGYYNQTPNSYKSDSDKSIKGALLGFLITFFAGIVGFILCLILGDEDCRKASIITFCVCCGVVLFVFILWIIILGGFFAFLI